LCKFEGVPQQKYCKIATCSCGNDPAHPQDCAQMAAYDRQEDSRRYKNSLRYWTKKLPNDPVSAAARAQAAVEAGKLKREDRRAARESRRRSHSDQSG